MFGISTAYLRPSELTYHGIKNYICNVGKNTLNFLVKNQHALSITVWSYFFIEVGRVAATTTFGENYVYNLDTCREFLCSSYSNKSAEIDDYFFSPVLEFRCSEHGDVSYSFIECLQDLCKYIRTIGESFYACVDFIAPTEFFNINETSKNITLEEVEISLPVIEYWNKICPKKEFRHPDKQANKLKELAYLTDCLERLCTPDNFIRFKSSKDIRSLCANKDIMKLYELLHRLSRAIKKLQKDLGKSDSTTLVSNIVVALATVVGGGATIAAAIITYRTTRAAQILQHALPSLDEGVRTISKAATQTTRAILRGTSIVEEMLPPEALQTLQELSNTINASADSPVSFHSAVEELAPKQEIKVSFDPKINFINVVGGIGGAGGSIIGLAGTGGKGGGGGGGGHQLQLDQTIENIVRSTLDINANFPIFDKSSPLPTLDISSFLPDLGSKVTPDFISKVTPNLGIKIDWWFSYLKNSLPNWQDAYCYYEGIEKFLLCKLPRPPFDNYISFYLNDIKKFFYKNPHVLCTPQKQDLWCNWGTFLELILSERNISLINNDCEWDHFGLRVNPIDSNTYFFQALGTCYNETNFIKV